MAWRTFISCPCGRESFRKLPSTFLSARRSSVNIRLLSMWPGDFPSTYINFTCHGEAFHQLSSTLQTVGRPSVNFRQLKMQPGEHPRASVSFPCVQENFCQLSSYFCASWRLFINNRKLSVFAGRPSINFCQHSVVPRDFPWTSVNSPCSRDTFNFCQLSVQSGHLPSNAINFLCGWATFHLLPSAFGATERCSVNFPSTFCSAGRVYNLVSTFCIARSPFINFTCGGMTLCLIPSTFRAAGRPCIIFCQLSVQLRDLASIFINILSDWKTVCQLSVWPGDLPSVSDNFPCIRETFHQLPSTFCAAWRHSANFRELS